MKPLTECFICMEELVHQTATLATEDETLRRQAILSAQKVVDLLLKHDAAPANIATIFHRKIKKITGNPDPFSKFKQREIERSKKIFDLLKGEVKSDLETLVKFSVKGNAFDFFRSEEKISEDFQKEIHFSINHIDLLKKRLIPGKRVLFLADNAGESFFDLPLVKFLSDFGVCVLYVVKGKPAQNDITMKDLEFSGLRQAFPHVLENGIDAVGLNLSVTDRSFRKLFYEVDTIIAKGMAHYETMETNTDERLFFLLKAKCKPVAAAIGVPYESYVLKNARFL